MTVEREVKLPVSPAFRLPDLGGVLPGIRMEARPPRSLDAVYLDTEDLRLARWGSTLRYREGEGWTVKLPSSGDDVMIREEVAFDGPSGVVPEAAVDLVRAFVRGAEVSPLAQLRTERTVFALVRDDGEELAEVVDDDVTVLRGLAGAVRFREIEIEATDAAPAGLLAAAVARLRWNGAGQPDPTPKVVRALGPAATSPPDVVAPDLPAKPTAAEMVRASLASSVVRLLVHDAAVRLDEDVEGVHQERVAARRLRSNLRTFGPLLDRSAIEPVRVELRWLGELLGGARDADVLLDRFRRRAEEARPDERQPIELVVESLQTHDAGLHAALMDGIRSPRFSALLDLLVLLANDPPFLPEADGPAAPVLRPLLDRPWKALSKAVKAAGDDPPDEALHDIRIRAKRVRYAAEAVAPVAGGAATRLAEAAADLQGVLGEHQDAVVAEAWLRGWAAERREPEVAFVAGVLAGIERGAATQMRGEWRKVWKRVRRAAKELHA